MGNIRTVFAWEFNKHIKSPVFLILTFIIPGIMVLAGFLPNFVIERIQQEEVKLWLVDETLQIAPLLEYQLADSRYDTFVTTMTIDQARDRLEEGEADALLHITAQSLETGVFTLYIKKPQDISRTELVQAIQPAFTQYRLERAGISHQQFSYLLARPSLQVLTVTGEEEQIADFLIPMFTGLFLFVSILFSGQILMQSVIKEKRNRIIEILLSSLSADRLLAGKILAFGALTLLQVGIWASVAGLVATRFIDLSDLNLDYTQLVLSLPYYLLGYLLLASIFAAMAATMKDAESGGQAQGLILLIPMLPIFLATPLLLAPNSLFAQVMSFIPIFTPATMFMRLGATTVPLWEIIATLMILIVSTYGFLRLGARIYAGSLLKYDTAAGIRDVLAMLRSDKA